MKNVRQDLLHHSLPCACPMAGWSVVWVELPSQHEGSERARNGANMPNPKRSCQNTTYRRCRKGASFSYSLNAFLPKPIDSVELDDQLGRFLSPTAQA